MTCYPTARIIILNYNGKDLLERFLPSVIESAEASRYPCGVMVLDNASSDDSVSFVKTRFPEVEVAASSENKVLCSYNKIAEQLRDDVIILLNNDIRTEKSFVDSLLSHFLDKQDILFVATHGDRAMVKIDWGTVVATVSYPGSETLIERSGYTFSAGIAAFDRKKFVELGGYDEIYLPGIYEDVDLCYRGWKRGWGGAYEPEAKKYHIGQASFKKRYDSKEIEKIAFRNGILFMIKNITDPSLLLYFGFMLLCRMTLALLLGKWHFWGGFKEAVIRTPRALRSRREMKKQYDIKDVDLIKKINEAVVTNLSSTPKVTGLRRFS